LQQLLTICSLGIASAVKGLLGPRNHRSFVKINVQNYETTFLFDTGSMVTLMSEQEFRKIPIEKRPKQIPSKVKLTGVAANSPLQLKGVYPLDLSIQNRKINLPVFVVKNMTQKNILGRDAIKELGLNFNGRTGQITLDGPNQFQTAEVCTVNKVYLEPFQVATVTLATPKDWVGHGTGLFRCRTVDHPLLYSSDGLVDFSKDTFTAQIKNCSPLEIRLDRKEKLGHVESLRFVNYREIDGEKLSRKLKTLAVEEEDQTARIFSATFEWPRKTRFLKQIKFDRPR